MTKSQAPSNKQAPITKLQIPNETRISGKNSRYDLEARTLEYTKNIVRLCKKLPYSIVNKELCSQLIRSSGSIGANYREANDSLSKKDFGYRVRIARKEAKESLYWLELLKESNLELESDVDILMDEAGQLKNILSAIAAKA